MTGSSLVLACAGCGGTFPPTEPFPFRCPGATPGDDVEHVLAPHFASESLPFPTQGDVNPFIRFRERLFPYRLARERGLTDDDFVALTRTLDSAVRDVDGRGFVETPYGRSPELSDDLRLGGLWFKDETQNVTGTHKGRHLFGAALTLEVLDRTRGDGAHGARELAIASCGNAALAAAVIAKAAGRVLEVDVPEDAHPKVLGRLKALGARVVQCARASDGPPGDPCLHRFREAVEGGALPFSVQGPESSIAVDGGKTLGYEIAVRHAATSASTLDRVAIQVGGGALASAVARAFREAEYAGLQKHTPALHAVQTAGCHPLYGAWRALAEETLVAAGVEPAPAREGGPPEEALATAIHRHVSRANIAAAVARAARARSRYMRPWGRTPESVATAILDDETYDWLAVCEAMLSTGGWPIVVGEELLIRARDRARAATGVPVDATGAAGLAGVFALAEAGALGADEHVAVLFTGVER